MGDENAPEHVAEGVWLPIPEAARRLRVTPQAVRGRIRRGTLEAREERRGNRARTLVMLPAGVAEAASEPAPERVPESVPERDDTLAEFRARVEGLEAVVEAQRQHIEDLRAELQRRRWPGLWPMLRRLWWGEGSG